MPGIDAIGLLRSRPASAPTRAPATPAPLPAAAADAARPPPPAATGPLPPLSSSGVPVYGLGRVALPPGIPSSLPARVGLGVNTIDDRIDPRVTGPDPSIQVTVFTPTPTAQTPGTFADLTARTFAAPLPERCVIGDGSRRRVFAGIDQRPGTPLDRALRLILAQVPRTADGRFDPEQVVTWVTTNVERFLRKTPGAATNDPGPELPWDKRIDVGPEVDAVWQSVATVPVGAPPTPTGASFPVVPFERYLELGYGYCIQKSILAVLLLSRCGVDCRLVAGAIDEGPGRSSGHTWVELGDGRWLDPTWQVVAQPTTAGVVVPGFRAFAGSYRLVNERFPFLIL